MAVNPGRVPPRTGAMMIMPPAPSEMEMHLSKESMQSMLESISGFPTTLGSGLTKPSDVFNFRGLGSIPTQWVDPMTNTITDVGKIAIRMGWDGDSVGRTIPFQHLTVAKKTDGDRVVFLLHENTPMMIEDGAAMFPSDALILKLRMLSP